MSTLQTDVAKPTAKRRKAKRAKRINAAELSLIRGYLGEWLRGVHPGRMSWLHLEDHTGFSRQALSAKPEIAELYERIKIAQRPDARKKRPASVDERILRLQAEVRELRKTIDEYDERWARIAYHTANRNIDLDELQQPLPQLNREEPRKAKFRPRGRA